MTSRCRRRSRTACRCAPSSVSRRRRTNKGAPKCFVKQRQRVARCGLRQARCHPNRHRPQGPARAFVLVAPRQRVGTSFVGICSACSAHTCRLRGCTSRHTPASHAHAHTTHTTDRSPSRPAVRTPRGCAAWRVRRFAHRGARGAARFTRAPATKGALGYRRATPHPALAHKRFAASAAVCTRGRQRPGR